MRPWYTAYIISGYNARVRVRLCGSLPIRDTNHMLLYMTYDMKLMMMLKLPLKLFEREARVDQNKKIGKISAN